MLGISQTLPSKIHVITSLMRNMRITSTTKLKRTTMMNMSKIWIPHRPRTCRLSFFTAPRSHPRSQCQPYLICLDYF